MPIAPSVDARQITTSSLDGTSLFDERQCHCGIAADGQVTAVGATFTAALQPQISAPDNPVFAKDSS